jgi:hypothetical protein
VRPHFIFFPVITDFATLWVSPLLLPGLQLRNLLEGQGVSRSATGVNPLKHEAHLNTQLFTITKIKWLTLFKEITVYSENHSIPINTLCGQSADAYC